MEKLINLILQTIAYFIIVYICFFVAQKIGIQSKTSIWPFAIGSTFVWLMFQGTSVLKKHRSNKGA